MGKLASNHYEQDSIRKIKTFCTTDSDKTLIILFYDILDKQILNLKYDKSLHLPRCAAMTVQTGTRLTAFSIFGLVPLHFGLITNLECQSFS